MGVYGTPGVSETSIDTADDPLRVEFSNDDDDIDRGMRHPLERRLTDATIGQERERNQAVDSFRAAVCVQRGHRPAVPTVQRQKEVERFGSAGFTHDETVRTHAK